MPSLALIQTFLREVLLRDRVERKVEPDLVMDDPEKVAAFTRAGREDGVMAPVYLFHCAQVCEVVRPGDTVLDLGCGPGTQLAMVARLNPQARFIGMDLSLEMLDKAKAYFDEQGLTNITLHQGDITNLSDFAAQSIDAVMSTVVLHHLPDIQALERVFSEVARVLKPDGGMYIVDFGRLKSDKSIEYFAHQYADRQPELFTLDYLYSLQAAFTKDDFHVVAEKHLPGRAQVFSTFLMPFMVAIKSPSRRKQNDDLTAKLEELKSRMPEYHKRDLKDLRMLFRLSGLRTTLLE
ncbi:MAG: class I SAM-dependent methyltransferase [Desulfomicrobium sp.]|nr:class I SAM-dependent methyltransferase [Desulfomicrobium sp.]